MLRSAHADIVAARRLTPYLLAETFFCALVHTLEFAIEDIKENFLWKKINSVNEPYMLNSKIYSINVAYILNSKCIAQVLDVFAM